MTRTTGDYRIGTIKHGKETKYIMATANTPKRASTFAPGIGLSLDGILDKDVVVTHASISERMYDGDLRPIVIITLDTGDVYHAWSQSLADKVSQIPTEEYPLTFKFTRVATRRPGQTVITFE